MLPCHSRSASKVSKEAVEAFGHVRRVLVPVPVVFWVDVEALGVARPAHGRDNWSLRRSVVDVGPVYTSEERVLLYASGTATNVAEAAGTVDGTE